MWAVVCCEGVRSVWAVVCCEGVRGVAVLGVWLQQVAGKVGFQVHTRIAEELALSFLLTQHFQYLYYYTTVVHREQVIMYTALTFGPMAIRVRVVLLVLLMLAHFD